ncbi:MAG TPA: saccharopine dehydrogenase NADP-binding domain-containing protein, partial [Longimicrobiales bacterium]|nr:saccharopine dehydrogenase NADP-binding domain-containing protein [Longimicrobiales bacterium]
MTVILYGATGYTGRLITRLATHYDVRPVLAGRNAGTVAALAAEHGLEHRVFGLESPEEVERGLAGAAVVLHCAGPFMRTYQAMSDACLATGTHYLDITGEIDVFEGLAARSAEAEAAGVMLLPGVGYDVVPSDCLAAHLAGRLPGARRLVLAISGSGPLSHGTASTAVENQHRGGMIRRDGRLVSVPAAWRTMEVDFGDGRSRTAVSIPWGDVATAWYSTGIPDIEVYAAVPPRLVKFIRASRHLGWLLRSRPVKALQRRLLRARPAGPDEHELEHGTSHIYGRVEHEDGRTATGALRGPNGYLLTAHAA